MTGRRALIRRPRRKMHLAHYEPLEGVWVTWCDLLVADDEQTAVHEYTAVHGVRSRLVKELQGIVRDHSGGHLCAHCRRFLLLIELLQHDRSHGVAYEYGRAA